ncbi:hypothetical protein NC653_024024 [Populus alba x Populus x berolinensis]|uniref:Uncharacterized protein n=1 Tax=Populus alba x Populus x berolinensis TaxID=444605 RepID=A0AAD6MIQ0_9ROSI|nr:hypothetical protein NC653_024024 [Populus alba x Populus x berolinensis]
MERLLYSSSPTPLKTHFKKPTPLLPRLCKLELPKPGFPSFDKAGTSGDVNSDLFANMRTPGDRLNAFQSFNNSNGLEALQDSFYVWYRNLKMPYCTFITTEVEAVCNTRKPSKTLMAGYCLGYVMVVFLLSSMFNPPSFRIDHSFCILPNCLHHTVLGLGVLICWFALHNTCHGPDHLAAYGFHSQSVRDPVMEQCCCWSSLGVCGHDARSETCGHKSGRFLTLLVIGAYGLFKEGIRSPQTPCVCLRKMDECDGRRKRLVLLLLATGIVPRTTTRCVGLIGVALPLAFPSRVAGALQFLIMFLFGTVIAMGSYTVFIGSCSEHIKDRVPIITDVNSHGFSSLIAIALGPVVLSISQLFGFSLY